MSENAILYSALAILGLPLLSYVLIFFFGKKLPRQGDWIGVGLMGLAELLAIRIFIAFWKIGDPAHRVEGAFTWIDLGGFKIDAGSSSRTRPTSRCISARWGSPYARSTRRTPKRAKATCSSPTIPPRVAPTSPM